MYLQTLTGKIRIPHATQPRAAALVVRLSRGRRGPLLLEAFPAKYRASLRRLERDRGFLAALGADRPRFYFRIAARRSLRAQHAGPLRLARLTPLGLVLELLIVEEQLLPSSEHEIRAAVHALQNLVLEFHGRAPFSPQPVRRHAIGSQATNFTDGPEALRAVEKVAEPAVADPGALTPGAVTAEVPLIEVRAAPGGSGDVEQIAQPGSPLIVPHAVGSAMRERKTGR